MQATPFKFTLLLLGLAACGGASSGAKSANDSDKGFAEFAQSHGGLSALGGGQSSGPAAPDTLRIDNADSPIMLDGILGEWPARFVLKEVVKGDAGKAEMRAAIMQDDKQLYVGAEIKDDKLVRTGSFGDGEDHASLVLVFPSGIGYELGFYAGKPGESAGSVRYLSGARKGREVPGAKIVEAPADGGYSFEAQIPWSALPEAATVRCGFRGALRYYQSDAPGSISHILASAQGDLASQDKLPPLRTRAEAALIDEVLSQRGVMNFIPKIDVYADVAGDAMKERIAVYNRFLTVTGPRYLGGTRFFYKELEGELVKLEVRPMTGRGKSDIIVRQKSTAQGGSAEWVIVLSALSGDDAPAQVFGHETQVEIGGKKIANVVNMGERFIEVTYDPQTSLDAASFKDASDAADVEPLLLPWGAVKSQTFQWDGHVFKKAKEVTQTARGPASRSWMSAANREAPPPPRPTPHPTADMSNQVIEQYKKDRGLPASTRARFDVSANVSGDGRPERVVLIGRDLIVCGPGFRDGLAYAFITLNPFTSDTDVREVSARDLTGDGAQEIVVKGTRTQKMNGSDDTVTQEILLVYAVKGEQLTRLFALETAREQSGKRVEATVSFSPKAMEVGPGRASGWSEKTFPWQQEKPGNGSLEPLVLPWGGLGTVRYRWDGQRFSR